VARRANGPNRFLPDDVLVAWDEYIQAGNEASDTLQEAIEGGHNQNQASLLAHIQNVLENVKCEKQPREHERTFKERQRTDRALRKAVDMYLDQMAGWVPVSIDRAVEQIRRDYRDDVAGIAQDLSRRIEEGDIEDAEGLQEALNADVDGSQRVIYTFQARLGLLATDNEEAYAEDFGEAPASVEAQMMAAMIRDVTAELESNGYDVNDPQPLETSEEAEEDDEPVCDECRAVLDEPGADKDQANEPGPHHLESCSAYEEAED
jgi:hypothetical protein